MRIALAGDDGYARHLGALLCSLFENQSGRYRIDVSVLSKDISPRNCGRLLTICRRFGSQLTVFPIDRDVFRQAPVPAHYSDVNYYRLLLPRLIDPRLDRILYLDGDIVVLGALDAAWETDVSDCALAAVKDGKRIREDGAQPTAQFNSGVLLFNLAYWRRHAIVDDVLAFIRDPANQAAIRYVDQDALNAVVGTCWRALPLAFNVQPFAFAAKRRTAFSDEERAAAARDPVVLHFCGPRKPWNYQCEHPQRGVYWRYARLTPWQRQGYSDFSLTAWAEKQRRRLAALVAGTAPPAMSRLLRVMYHQVVGRRAS
ncbi:MAG TPA: glycosyltransferase family 8 protein [Candidatus Binatia bacterium]|nr:glycosyltransferase family 8 protein [Candidatus Binatia bacterium]